MTTAGIKPSTCQTLAALKSVPDPILKRPSMVNHEGLFFKKIYA